MIDIDHFKSVNDTLGHDAGDQVLRSVAATLAGALRTEDLVGRWGGEEFLALLPETDLAGATRLAERVRRALAANPISIGVATHVDHDSDALVAAADIAMYLAKSGGRNAVHAAGDHPSPA